MPSWIDVDVIPEIARPEAVDKVLAEALSLRDRLRAAQEELAAAQADLERQEQADVAQAAERIRSGAAPGAIPAAISKSRQKVELAKRNASALALASEAAQRDLAETMTTNADEWLGRIETATVDSRERAAAALAALASALDEMGTAASASAWVQNGQTDSRWDRRSTPMLIGSIAPSSARVSANSQPFTRQQLLDFVAELINPPSPSPARVLASPVEARVGS
jgi:hypothetical protein